MYDLDFKLEQPKYVYDTDLLQQSIIKIKFKIKYFI